jgi:peptidyl-prolyl cis-trans isomerase SurA
MNKYEIDDLTFAKGKKITKGINTIFEANNKFYVLKVSTIIPSCPKSINEAKGIIISDYQNHLEKEWLTELAKKYPLKVYDEIIYNLSK